MPIIKWHRQDDFGCENVYTPCVTCQIITDHEMILRTHFTLLCIFSFYFNEIKHAFTKEFLCSAIYDNLSKELDMPGQMILLENALTYYYKLYPLKWERKEDNLHLLMARRERYDCY